MRSEVNWLPLSLKISVGKPTLENTSSKASATLSVSILGKATALGYFVAKSTIVKIYQLPSSDTGVMELTDQPQHGKMAHPLLASPQGELLSPFL